MKQLDKATALIILDTIEKKLLSEPERYGKALTGKLKHLRTLKISRYRVVYKVKRKYIEVFVIAVGLRKDDTIYNEAIKRLHS